MATSCYRIYSCPVSPCQANRLFAGQLPYTCLHQFSPRDDSDLTTTSFHQVIITCLLNCSQNWQPMGFGMVETDENLTVAVMHFTFGTV